MRTIISLIVSPFILVSTQQSTFYYNLVPDIFVAFVGPLPVLALISIPAFFLLIYTVFCLVKKQ